MNQQRNLTLCISCILDGFIATESDDISFLDAVTVEGEDYGYQAFMDTVEMVIVGSRTYEKVRAMGYEFPHGERETYVITGKAKPANRNIQYYSGEVADLVKNLKARPGGTIFCDGGAQVANLLLKADLIDELVISIIPVLLGSGIRLFHEGHPNRKLQLLESQAYPSGLVQVRYSILKP